MNNVRTEIENAIANAGAEASEAEVTAMLYRVIVALDANDLIASIPDAIDKEVDKHFAAHPYAAWNDGTTAITGTGSTNMERREAGIEWILNEDIRLEVRLENGAPTGDVRVYAEDGRECWLTMSPDRTELLFDGRYVDVGDDYPRFLGIMDAANEGVTFIGDCLAPGHPEPDEL